MTRARYGQVTFGLVCGCHLLPRETMIAGFEDLLYRTTPAPGRPIVVYLPGVHGDWTSFHRIRPFLERDVALVELSYPKSEIAGLPEIAAKIVRLVRALDVRNAHLLGESFGSLVAWRMALDAPDLTASLILAAGFTSPPPLRRAHLAFLALRTMPTPLFELLIDAYVAIQNRLGTGRPTPGEQLSPFFALRSDDGRLAVARRMETIQHSDLRAELSRIRAPVRYLGGKFDLVVPALREARTISSLVGDFESETWGAPHTLMVTHPERCAAAILRWIRDFESRA